MTIDVCETDSDCKYTAARDLMRREKYVKLIFDRDPNRCRCR